LEWQQFLEYWLVKVYFEMPRGFRDFDYECLKKKKNRIMNLGGEMIGVINLVTK
jgi:hypothetical protein